MSTETKNKLVPRLRFPEFQNAGEWEVDIVGNVFDLTDGFSFSSSDFSDKNANSKQVIRITDINNKNKNEDKVYISITRVKELKIEKYEVTKGDLLLSLTGAAGFNFFIWNSEEAYINQRTMKLSPKKKENKSLTILLEPLIHKKINAIGTGQNNNLSKEALKDILFPFPSPKEQQKIASCLSSLDEVITGEQQKLELLKQHKKGLLQNLFPQEGETVPKLRFPEFKNAGEWEVKRLGEIGDFFSGGTPDTQNEDYWNGDILWFTPSEIKKKYLKESNRKITKLGLKNSSAKLLPKGSILITTRATIGDVGIALEECTTNQGFQSLVVKQNNSNEFWYYYIFNNKSELDKRASGSTFKEITKSKIISIPVLAPSFPEQQKIASCLSSLDEIITAQTQKIEQLQRHKKGLLQGLFPNMNEQHG